MRKLLGLPGLAAIVFVVVELPLILAQRSVFYCAPFSVSDVLAPQFRTLSPYCCTGVVDNELKVGKSCRLASRAKMRTVLGQDLYECALGATEVCCERLTTILEMQPKPWLSYCDATYMITPDPANVVSYT